MKYINNFQIHEIFAFLARTYCNTKDISLSNDIYNLIINIGYKIEDESGVVSILNENDLPIVCYSHVNII